MKVQILRPESVTPIGLYLDRGRRDSSFEARADLAVVLLHREREYRAMYASRWRPESPPAPDPDGPFAPWDLTEPAAETLRRLLILTNEEDAVEPDDLFGLKGETAAGLASVLRPVRAHLLGWLAYARILSDLCRFPEAVDAAETAIALGERLEAFALLQGAAYLGAGTPGLRDGEAIGLSVETRVREATPGGEVDPGWARRALETLDERLRRAAVRTRSRVEGEGFLRFLSTEREFCEAERTRELVGFDDEDVPPALRHLTPLARELGVGDDVCRAHFTRAMPPEARRAARASVLEAGSAIDVWLAALGEPPYRGEASAFFWLRHAVEEMDD